MSRIIVFAGPSLPAPPGEGFEFRPPAAQGDVLEAAILAPDAIVLIDGYFHGMPAVFHKEILWALSQDIPVYGAASMGALRAAELAPLGMVGVGDIYARFASGAVECDDEVALAHAPAELGYATLSEPLANIRATLRAASANGVLKGGSAESVLAQMTGLYYADRTRDAVLSAADSPIFTQWVEAGNWVDQKQRDALACLERIKADQAAGTRPPRKPFTFRHTDAFQSLINDLCSRLPSKDAFELLSLLDPAGFEAHRTQAMIETLAASLSRHQPANDGPGQMLQAVAEFREREGLPDAESLDAWLKARGVDIDTLSKHLDVKVKTAQQIQGHHAQIMEHLLANLRMDGKLSG